MDIFLNKFMWIEDFFTKSKIYVSIILTTRKKNKHSSIESILYIIVYSYVYINVSSGKKNCFCMCIEL